jgi:hypothetical protein
MFEYISNLNKDIQKYEEWPDSPNGIIEITLSSSSYTIIVDTFDATTEKTALNLQKNTLAQASSWGDNFKVLKQDTIIIDGITSYDMECNYDRSQNSSSIESKHVRINERFIFIERNRRLYLIRFTTEASQSDGIRDFQHILDTWRWK